MVDKSKKEKLCFHSMGFCNVLCGKKKKGFLLIFWKKKATMVKTRLNTINRDILRFFLKHKMKSIISFYHFDKYKDLSSTCCIFSLLASWSPSSLCICCSVHSLRKSGVSYRPLLLPDAWLDVAWLDEAAAEGDTCGSGGALADCSAVAGSALQRPWSGGLSSQPEV